MRVDLSSAIARPGYAPRLGRKSLYLFASALFAVSGAAAAQTTELDCADRTHPDHHWSVTLNEENGTGTVVVLGTNYTMANKPAAFTPDEVRVTTNQDSILTSMFWINRTTLDWHWASRLRGQEETPSVTGGQCKIVTNPERKF